jgi:hypothetical protein
LNRNPFQRPSSQQLVQSFLLPPINESIEEIVFEEMQNRRSLYEQEKHMKTKIEQPIEKPIIQPVVCSTQVIYLNNPEAKIKGSMIK